MRKRWLGLCLALAACGMSGCGGCFGTTEADIDLAADAIRSIASDGPRWTYRQDRGSGEYEPHPDPRTLPRLSFRLSEAAIHHVGESS